MSEDDYEGLTETLELLSIDGMRRSITEAEADIVPAERFPSRKHYVH